MLNNCQATILERGPVLKDDTILFLSYKLGPELHNWRTLYLDTETDKIVNLYTPSITQWHYDPIAKELEEELVSLIKQSKEVQAISTDCMWYRQKMDYVRHLFQKESVFNPA